MRRNQATIDKVFDDIRKLEPDIVLLQEVDEGVPRSRHDRQVDLFGDALQLPHRAFHSNVRLRAGHYGNASEIVRDALRLMEEREKEREIKLRALRKAAKTGFDAIDQETL